MGQNTSKGLSEDQFWNEYYKITHDYSVGPATTWIDGNKNHKKQRILDYYRNNKYHKPSLLSFT